MRVAPILLGGLCTAIALLLSLRGEEPPPIIVRERHLPVSPAIRSAPRPDTPVALSPDAPTAPEAPAETPAGAPLLPECVPGRLCATPQLPYRADAAPATVTAAVVLPEESESMPPPRLDATSVSAAAPPPVTVPVTHEPPFETRAPTLPAGAVMLRVRPAPGATPLHTAAVVKGVGKKEARDFECPDIRQGPFCFACQISCGSSRNCAPVVRACARLPHCTFAKVNEGRSFGTLKTSDASYLDGVTAAAAAKKEAQLAACALAGAQGGAPDAHAAEKGALRDAFLAGKGTAYFVHIQNAGGTAMCKMAQHNGLAAPQESPEESGVFGRNCNPPSADAPQIWKGSVEAQRTWRRQARFRFVANEMALPPHLAWGDFLYVVVVRHPRELALARFRGSPMYHHGFDDRKFAAFLNKGLQGGGGVHNVMTRQLCGCLDAPQLAEWREEELRAFKLQPVGERHLACAKRRLERFSVVLVTDMLHASAPLLEAELGWKDTALLQRKVNRQAGCDAQQMYGNDSAVTAGLHHAYNLDLQVYAHARMLFCRALAKARSKRS